MKELCRGVRRLLIEDFCVGVRQLQMGVRHLCLEDLCVGVRQLAADGARQLSMNKYSWNWTTPTRRMDECIKLEIDSSN